MTTIRATQPHRMKDDKKMQTDDRRRYQINTTSLAEEIKLVEDAIQKRIPEIQEFAMSGDIPVPIPHINDTLTTISYTVWVALEKLKRDMKHISKAQWERYEARYQEIPKRGDGGIGDEGITNVVFYDEDKIGMIDLSDEIATYIKEFSGVKIPYLHHKGSASHKKIGSLALIHTANYLRGKDEQASKEIPQAGDITPEED